MTSISEITSWELALRLCLSKFDYEKRTVTSSVSQKDRVRAMYNRLVLKDPCKGFDSEALALRYITLFNERYGIGERVELDKYGTTFHSMLRYQVEDRLPVLTGTYYMDGTAYVERKKFSSDGSFVECGAPYPVSEFGVTGFPDNPKDVRTKTYFFDKFHLMVKDLSKVLKDMRHVQEMKQDGRYDKNQHSGRKI